MAKTALEVVVSQNTKDIADMQDGLKEFSKSMISSIEGLRKDMSDRGEKMIQMLNDQNLMLIKSQTSQQSAIIKELSDHKADDAKMFSDIKSRMGYYLGCGVGAGAIISTFIVGIDMWLRK
jgi:hypothetical protein